MSQFLSEAPKYSSSEVDAKYNSLLEKAKLELEEFVKNRLSSLSKEEFYSYFGENGELKRNVYGKEKLNVYNELEDLKSYNEKVKFVVAKETKFKKINPDITLYLSEKEVNEIVEQVAQKFLGEAA